MRDRLVWPILSLAAALVFGSCGSGTDVPGGCTGSVATQTQSGNTVNITGSFKDGQPIMRLSKNGTDQQLVSGTYDNGTASFDVAGLAKGAYTVTWILSCFNADGEVTMASQIKTVTVN